MILISIFKNVLTVNGKAPGQICQETIFIHLTDHYKAMKV